MTRYLSRAKDMIHGKHLAGSDWGCWASLDGCYALEAGRGQVGSTPGVTGSCAPGRKGLSSYCTKVDALLSIA
jgi:hypothetical protein